MAHVAIDFSWIENNLLPEVALLGGEKRMMDECDALYHLYQWWQQNLEDKTIKEENYDE
jgi:hypothetical protein